MIGCSRGSTKPLLVERGICPTFGQTGAGRGAITAARQTQPASWYAAQDYSLLRSAIRQQACPSFCPTRRASALTRAIRNNACNSTQIVSDVRQVGVGERSGRQRLAEDPSALDQNCRMHTSEHFAQPNLRPICVGGMGREIRWCNPLERGLLLYARIRICAFDHAFLRCLAGHSNCVWSRCPPQHATGQLPKKPRNGQAILWVVQERLAGTTDDRCLPLQPSHHCRLHLGRR